MGSVGLIWAYCYVQAAPPVMETPINGFGTPTTVSISSTTPTKIPTSQTSGRVGVFVSVYSSAPYAVAGFLGNCTSTSLSSTLFPIDISTNSSVSRYVSLREDVCLWLVSIDSTVASRPVHYQEVKQ